MYIFSLRDSGTDFVVKWVCSATVTKIQNISVEFVLCKVKSTRKNKIIIHFHDVFSRHVHKKSDRSYGLSNYVTDDRFGTHGIK